MDNITNEQVLLKGLGGVRKDKFTFKEVVHFMNQSVNPTVFTTRKKPSKFKKGDVFTGASVNFKHRPFVVAKVTKKGYYCIPLTASENDYTLIKGNSRFFPTSSLTNNIYLVPEEQIKDNFVGVFDDNRSINKALNLIINEIKTNFL